ncbi:MAG TPA: dehydrogenase, partial [Mycobacterium sp.]|nr:dehydrogenase [Mycobacterium sp.]
VSFDEMISAVEAGLGKPIYRIPITPAMFRAAGRLADVAARFLPLDSGFSYEAAWLLTEATPTDDSKTLQDLDLQWRSPTDAITASVRA